MPVGRSHIIRLTGGISHDHNRRSSFDSPVPYGRAEAIPPSAVAFADGHPLWRLRHHSSDYQCDPHRRRPQWSGADGLPEADQSDPFAPISGPLVWTFIGLPIIYHTVFGLWLTYTAQPNINQYPYTKNAFYLFQRVSALVLVAFILFHVTAMKGWWTQSLAFNSRDVTGARPSAISGHWFVGWFIYPVGIMAACYHLANGFWTAAISWGVTVSTGATEMGLGLRRDFPFYVRLRHDRPDRGSHPPRQHIMEANHETLRTY